MTYEFAPPISPEEARDRSLLEDLRELARDARTYAEAELAFQKSRATYAGDEVKSIAISIAAAAALVFFALMALVLGALLALTPLITAWGATALVFAVLLIGAVIFAFGARSRWRRMKSLMANGSEV